jgi:Undecaprenyl-phosphate glucose phosphotransferase
MEQLQNGHNGHLLEIVGVYDDRSGGNRLPAEAVAGQSVRGTTADLVRAARTDGPDAIAIALPQAAAARVSQLMTLFSQVPADLLLCPDLALATLPQSPRGRGASAWGTRHVVKLYEQPYKGCRGLLKWTEDKAIAALGLVLLSPVVLLIATLIRLTSPGPVLFRQTRFGFNNVPIEILKFRTMYHHFGDPTGASSTTRDDPRVTPIGRILRRTSLDELPQLFNVLQGDMSIVGPRAHAIDMKIADQLYYDAVQSYAARHRVKPGITGLAQVSGLRGEINTLEKARRRIEYDLEYIENWSIWIDLWIIVKTIIQVPFDKDAY